MTTTPEVPMPEPMFWTWQGPYNTARVFTDSRVSADFAACSHPFVSQLYTADQLRAYADARCEKLMSAVSPRLAAFQAERDALAARVKAMEDNDRRYRWLRKFSANSAPMPATIPVLVWAGQYHSSWLHKLDAAIDSAMGATSPPPSPRTSRRSARSAT
jgi:hypothetical protein